MDGTTPEHDEHDENPDDLQGSRFEQDARFEQDQLGRWPLHGQPPYSQAASDAYSQLAFGQPGPDGSVYGQRTYGQHAASTYDEPAHGPATYAQATPGQASAGQGRHGQALADPYPRPAHGTPPFAAHSPPAHEAPAHEAPADSDDDTEAGGGWGAPFVRPEAQTGEVVAPARRELLPLGSRQVARREPAGGEDEDEGGPGGAKRTMPLWQELPLLMVVAFCLAVLIRTFLLQAFYIPSGSMEQTLLVGDRVLVNKIVYDVRQPARGEVIVFRGTDSWATENFAEPEGGLVNRVGRALGDLVGVSRPSEKDFIKRVIAVGGDRVSCCDPKGRLYVNGKGIDEPYVVNNSSEDVQPDPRVCRSRRFDEVLVPPGQLFVMGDHRIVSQDSRCQGTVPVENVIGRAFVIVWPSGRWDTLSVPETFADIPGPVAMGPAGRGGRSGGTGERAPGSGAVAITLPILASLGVTALRGRNRRWGRRTLSR